MENVISGISVVQAYNAQDWEAKRVDEESTAYRDQAIGASKDRNRFLPGLYGIAGIAFGLLVTVGGYLTKSGDITTGQLVTFTLISTRMTMPMFIFGMLVNQLQKGEASARRVFALVDLEPTITDKPDAKELEGAITSVEFDNVHFTYPYIDKGAGWYFVQGICWRILRSNGSHRCGQNHNSQIAHAVL